MTMTTRVRSHAVFSELAPPRTGRRGRPRLQGDRIGTACDIAHCATCKTAPVARSATTATVVITERTCPW
jgi:hypothetical protein